MINDFGFGVTASVPEDGGEGEVPVESSSVEPPDSCGASMTRAGWGWKILPQTVVGIL